MRSKQYIIKFEQIIILFGRLYLETVKTRSGNLIFFQRSDPVSYTHLVTFAKIVEDMPNCAGIKECSVAFADCVDIVHRVGDKCTVFSGEDLMMGGHVLFGAEAAIIASANLIPAAWSRMFEDARTKNIQAVIEFQKKYYPLFDLLFAEINPAPLKYTMKKIGMDAGEVSTPLLPCSKGLQAKLDSIIEKMNIQL